MGNLKRTFWSKSYNFHASFRVYELGMCLVHYGHYEHDFKNTRPRSVDEFCENVEAPWNWIPIDQYWKHIEMTPRRCTVIIHSSSKVIWQMLSYNGTKILHWQKLIDTVEHYYYKWKQRINASKCELILFRPPLRYGPTNLIKKLRQFKTHINNIPTNSYRQLLQLQPTCTDRYN